MPIKDKDEYNDYMNQYMKERWKRRRLQATIHLGEVCSKCGVNYKIVPLDFHHTDPSNKKATVARLSSVSETKFWAEINKCILLCEDCHKDYHYN